MSNRKEIGHQACIEVTRQLSGKVYVPATVIPEAAYLVFSRYGHRAMRRFLKQLQAPAWSLLQLDSADLIRAHDVLTKYQDSKLDFVDSSIVAMAERLRIGTVLTLDQRDFRMIRPKHVPHFTILPE